MAKKKSKEQYFVRVYYEIIDADEAELIVEARNKTEARNIAKKLARKLADYNGIDYYSNASIDEVEKFDDLDDDDQSRYHMGDNVVVYEEDLKKKK